ncbi:multiple C2 and transmembrane domain-containing protein 1 isoform X2 [Clupea harengus]|uniref:Multiple C2 and transmembrane domain-containing protein 1 isoform X2 n=1 Tax=Clupea harengus TaxID=7950 RepID=A0A6P8GDZ5_CLUHA|nr:multiple C2 and transmembrane domain-containing protein 1 isoform X2 [Clupea harengus]
MQREDFISSLYSLHDFKRHRDICICSAVSITSCCLRSMETGPEECELGGDSDSLPYQKRMWKQFQAKSKPFMSNKLVSSRSEGKKEGGIWIFKKKKQHQNALVRTLSSSHPNLHTLGSLCVGEEDKPPRCGTAEPRISKARVMLHENTAGGEMAKQAGTVKQSSPKPTVSHLVQSHHKSASLGSACLESSQRDPVPRDEEKKQLDNRGLSIHAPGQRSASPALPFSGMLQLDIVLKKGNNLAARDRGGTSDPYVKFKLSGKEVYRSRTIQKNLNPVWEERVCLIVDSLHEPLYIKVFDYDFGLHDDFIGSAYLYLESLEQNRPLDVSLDLRDPHHPQQDLGTLDLVVTLAPKDRVDNEATMLLRRSWKRSSKTQQQSLRLSDLHRKCQLWSGIVSISLIEGRDLIPMDQNGFSDPYVKFRLGHQKYKSKTMPKTLNPQWREPFDLHLYEEEGYLLEISVWDKDTGRRDDFIGRCQLDLSTLSKEHTHKLELPLEEEKGMVVLLITLTASTAVSISDLSVNILDDPHERQQIDKRYGLLRSFTNVKDVGVVQVKVLRAEGLMAADVTGKSDPFCVVELWNDRLQTHTVYKNLSPEWNKVFTLNVKDIHSVLEVSVYDEDRDRSADFLGKVAIPLLHIHNGEQKAYVLKNKELTGPTKGVIFLEIDVIFNSVKASLRTVVPAERKYIEEEQKVSKQLLQQNFSRVKRCILFLINVCNYINSCFEWESPQRSILAFLLFVVVVWNFEIYMVPLSLLLLLAWNYFLLASGKKSRDGDVEAVEDFLQDEVEEYDRDDKDSEKKGFIDKLYAIQDVCVSVQNALDEVASYGERIKNTFNWTVPFLSWLAIASLSVATLVIYFIPLRYVVLVWGVSKFTRKLRDPYMIDNNELLDFLSRVPSDVQVIQYRELKLDPGQSPSKRKRNNPG